MLERLPEFSQEDAASDALVGDWDYHKLLVKTASAEELSDPHLAPSALLYRLFNEGGVWVYDTQHIQDKCRCSRERISATLESLPAEELETLAIEGQISVICQFCSREELFIL